MIDRFWKCILFNSVLSCDVSITFLTEYLSVVNLIVINFVLITTYTILNVNKMCLLIMFDC